MTIHPTVGAVTNRIRERSKETRLAYLARLEQARRRGPVRRHLSCTNLAHAFAAFGPHDKCVLRESKLPNIGIVSAYNDMLSAHQPLQRFPSIIKQAAREAGGVAQFAGGVPAMCDGVTQGQPGMELSLFGRDVIAPRHCRIALPQYLRCGVEQGVAAALRIELPHLGLVLVWQTRGHWSAGYHDRRQVAELECACSG